jgi:N-dimethylarginine dimethylaminohydrolase
MQQVTMRTDRLAYGVQSMTAPLESALVKPPGESFGRAFDDPAHGFLHPVDLALAQRQHASLVAVLEGLGVTVHALEAQASSPDLVYTFDTAMVTDRGAIVLRSGKRTRLGEERLVEAWLHGRGIPIMGRIDDPGTVDGGDCLWLRPDLLCIGRSLRTNEAGIGQLRALLPDAEVRAFDVPYAGGPDECLHLLSVISSLTDDAALVYLPLLPAGLFRLLVEMGTRLVHVPDAEFASLGCNVLAVRPGVLVAAAGNEETCRLLEAIGCEVHVFEATEIGVNGSGGPTCLTLPIQRAAT